MANGSPKRFFWRRAMLTTGPTWWESTLVWSPYGWKICPHATGRPQSTGRLHMPLRMDASAVPHGFVKRTSCPFGRPDSAQRSSSRRDTSGDVMTSNPRRQEISSTKVCRKNLRVWLRTDRFRNRMWVNMAQSGICVPPPVSHHCARG